MPSASPAIFGPSTGATLSDVATIKASFGLGTTDLTGSTIELRFSVSLTANGQVVRVLGGSVIVPTRSFTGTAPVVVPLSVVWDGRATGGAAAPSGTYSFRFFAALVQVKTVSPGSAPKATVKATALSPVATVALDAVAPALAITAPAPGAFVNASSVTVTGTVRDAHTVTVTVNGSQATVVPVAGATIFSATFSAFAFLPDGPATITAVATDAVGNQSAATATCFVDTKSPGLAITFPMDGLRTKLASFTITGTASDPAPSSGLDPALFNLTLDGEFLENTFDPGAGTFSAPTPALTDGQHEVFVSVRDRANNATQVRSLVLVDATAPELVITSPAEGAVLGAPSVTVTGSVRDASAVQVTVNGQPAEVTRDLSASLFAGTYSASIQLSNGPNTITVDATDVVGNVSTASRHVSVIPTAATRIQGEVRDTEGNPLVHVRVAVVADDAQTYTDADGQFNLTGVSGGEVVIHTDPSQTTNAGDYPAMNMIFKVTANVLNLLPRPIYLPKLDPGVFVDENVTTTVTNYTNSRLVGVALTIPPHALTFPDGTHSGMVSITEVPPNRTPQTLPNTVGPNLVITIQPEGTVASTPLPINMPNLTNLPNGFRVEFHSMDPNTGLFFFNGFGTVNGATIFSDDHAGITAFDWHFTTPPPPPPPPRNSDNPTDVKKENPPILTCSGIDPYTGSLEEEIATPGFRALGRLEQVRLVYRSETAFPMETVTWVEPFSLGFPVVGIEGRIGPRENMPPLTGTAFDTSGITFLLTTGNACTQGALFDAKALATGVYPAAVRISSWAHTFTPLGGALGPLRPLSAQIPQFKLNVLNRRKSPYGAGWTVGGLKRVHADAGRFNAVLEEENQLVTYRRPLFEVPNRGFEDAILGDWTDSSGVAGPVVKVVLAGQRLGNPQFAGFRFVQYPEGRYALMLSGPGAEASAISQVFRAGTALHFKALTQGFAPSRTATYFIDPTSFFVELVDPFDASIVLLSQRIKPAIVEVQPDEVFGDRQFSDHMIDTAAQSGKPLRVVFRQSEVVGPDVFTLVDDVVIDAPAGAVVPPEYISPNDDHTVFRNLASGFERVFTDGTVETYDAAGLLTTVSERHGNVTSYAYVDADGDGKAEELSTVTDPLGQVTRLVYGPVGKLSEIHEPGGATTLLTIGRSDEAGEGGELAQVQYPDGSLQTFGYDPANRHLLVSNTDGRHNVTTYTPNSVGRYGMVTYADGITTTLVRAFEPVFFLAHPAGSTSAFEPGAAVPFPPINVGGGNFASADVIDGRPGVPNQGQWYFQFDREGRRTKEFVGGVSRQYTYDARFNVIAERMVDGRNVFRTFDVNGNVLTTRNDLNETTTFTYEPVFNQVATVTDPNNHQTKIDYNPVGDPILITDALQHQTKLEYELHGLVTRTEDARHGETLFTYDSRLNLQTVSDPLHRVTVLGTNAVGDVTSVEDPLHRITGFSYDSMHRLTNVNDALHHDTAYLYDAVGNLTKVTDANNHSTTFFYDSRNRVSEVRNALAQATRFTYQVIGDRNAGLTVIQMTEPTGQQFNYSFTGSLGCLETIGVLPYGCASVPCTSCGGGGSLLAQAASGASEVNENFTYDLARRLSGSSIQQTSLVFQGLGRPARPIIDKTLAYDPAGNRTSLQLMRRDTKGELDWMYYYDDLNRLSRQTDWRARNFTYEYDELSRRKRVTRPNGVYTTYTYDAASQLLSMEHHAGDDGLLFGVTYEYDDAGNRTAVTYAGTHPMVGRHTYVYDDLNRLTGATHPQPGPLPDEFYTYDNVGNRLTSHRSSHYSYDPANRLLSDDQFIYTFDAAGFLTTRSRTGAGTTLKLLRGTQFQSNLQLSEFDLEDGTKSFLAYDSLLRRGAEAFLNTPTNRWWLHDNEGVVLEQDATDEPKQIMTHGPGIDEPLEISMRGDLVPTLMVQATQSDLDPPLVAATDYVDVYPLTDGLGSVMSVIAGNGVSVHTYGYDSFGNLLVDNGVALPTEYGYTGRELDRRTGLMYYRNRWYDPNVGRFLSEDPMLSGTPTLNRWNQFSYVVNQPMNWKDPLGLWKYYGNWGGPDWTGGLNEQYDPTHDSRYHPPVDQQDRGYKHHDICYYACRQQTHDCDSRKNCFKGCDRRLSTYLRDLRNDPSNDYHADWAATYFGWSHPKCDIH